MLLQQLFESDAKHLTFVFGRLNPPTRGHEQLLDTAAAQGGDYKIFVSQSQDKKKNPLDYATKIKFIREMFPKHADNVVEDASLNTIMKIASYIYDQGYNAVTFVAGSDRLEDMKKLLQAYNGVEGKAHGFYDFQVLDFVSSGEREDGAEGVAGISASGARAAAAEGDLESFKEATGAGELAKPLYDAVRKGMGLKDAVEEGKFRSRDIEEKLIDDEKLNDLKSKYLPDWEMLDHRILQAKYVAKDHRHAEDFVSYINKISEKMDHFAEVTQDVAEVTVKTTTFDVKGLTILDFKLALKVDKFAEDNDIEQVRMQGNFGMHEMLADLGDKISEAISAEEAIRSIVSTADSITTVYGDLKTMAEKWVYNNGTLKGFHRNAAGVGKRWYDKFFWNNMDNDLRLLLAKNPKAAGKLRDFFNIERDDKGHVSFTTIGRSLPRILNHVGEQMNNKDLKRFAVEWFKKHKDYEDYLGRVEAEVNDEDDDFTPAPKQPKDNVVGRQNAAAEDMVNQILRSIDKKAAGEIRNAIAREPNKLQALQRELNKRNIKVGESLDEDWRKKLAAAGMTGLMAMNPAAGAEKDSVPIVATIVINGETKRLDLTPKGFDDVRDAEKWLAKFMRDRGIMDWQGKIERGEPGSGQYQRLRIIGAGGLESIQEAPIELDRDDPMDPMIHSHQGANPGKLKYRMARAAGQLKDLASRVDGASPEDWKRMAQQFEELKMNMEQIRHALEELGKIKKKGGIRSRGITV